MSSSHLKQKLFQALQADKADFESLFTAVNGRLVRRMNL
jgi:hypothetical protein